MVKQKNYDIVKNKIRDNPGITFTQLYKLVNKKMSRPTFSSTLKSLKNNNKIYNENKGYHFYEQEKIKENISSLSNLLNISNLSRSELTILFERIYLLKKLKDLNPKPKIEEICKELIELTEFKNNYNQYKIELENTLKRMYDIYNNKTMESVKRLWKKIETKPQDMIERFFEVMKFDFGNFLVIFEKSIKDKINISISSNQKILFSNSTIQSINDKIFKIIFENIIFNPEFILTVKKPEDLKFNINISYNPFDNSDFFNLNLYSDKEDYIKKLKELIFEYKEIDKTQEILLLTKAKSDIKNRKEITEEINKYTSKLKIGFQKIIDVSGIKELIRNSRLNKRDVRFFYLSSYFGFKEKIEELDLRDGEIDFHLIYENTIREFKILILSYLIIYLISDLVKKENFSVSKIENILTEKRNLMEIQLTKSEKKELMLNLIKMANLTTQIKVK